MGHFSDEVRAEVEIVWAFTKEGHGVHRGKVVGMELPAW